MATANIKAFRTIFQLIVTILVTEIIPYNTFSILSFIFNNYFGKFNKLTITSDMHLGGCKVHSTWH